MKKQLLFVALSIAGASAIAAPSTGAVAAGPAAPAAVAAQPAASVPMLPTSAPAPAAKPAAADAPAAAASGPSCNCTKPVAKPAVKRVVRPRAPVDTAPAVPKAAKEAVEKSEAWANDPKTIVSMGDDGRIVFLYGQSTPTVVCSTLRVCSIELEPGETVLDKPHAGDPVRWAIEPAVTGSGPNKTVLVVVKPKDVGLDTNLMIPTDRRAYFVRLVSSDKHYVTRVSWYYPENEAKAWAAQREALAKKEAPVVSDLPPLSADKLNFKYTVEADKGKPSFIPVRVFDDGEKTYFQMSPNMKVDEAPAVVLLDSEGKEQLVNYRLKNGYYVIDRLFTKAALIAGVGGSQDRVLVTRDTCAKRNWFNSCVASE